MNDLRSTFPLLLLGAGLFAALLVVCADKVRGHIRETYGDVAELKVRWTLFGPWAPGNNNMKFKVSFTDGEGRYREMHAVTSFFGAVYLNE